MFISQLVDDCYYLAKHSRRSTKLIWMKFPQLGDNGTRVMASQVPKTIRMRAYKLFEADRKRLNGL